MWHLCAACWESSPKQHVNIPRSSRCLSNSFTIPYYSVWLRRQSIRLPCNSWAALRNPHLIRIKQSNETIHTIDVNMSCRNCTQPHQYGEEENTFFRITAAIKLLKGTIDSFTKQPYNTCAAEPWWALEVSHYIHVPCGWGPFFFVFYNCMHRVCQGCSIVKKKILIHIQTKGKPLVFLWMFWSP